MRTPIHHFFLSLSALAFSSSGHSASISNPSFETDTFNTSPGYISQAGNGPITGWTASVNGNTGLNPAVSSPFANNGSVPDGSQVAFIQTNGGATRTLSSTAGIAGLIPGRTYNVTYRVNSRTGFTVPTMGLVVNGAQVLQNQLVPGVGGSNAYKYVGANFTATSTTASLSISNTASADSALLLDNFVITENPNFSATPWNGDATSGLVSTTTYTHAYNFGNSAVNTTVNGVAFTAVTGGNPTVPGSFSFNMPSAFGTDANNVTGDSAGLANSFVYNNRNATLTLEGLMAGEMYRTSIFTVGFDNNPGRSSTLSANGERLTVDASGLGNNNGIRIDYEFVATGTTQSIDIDALGGSTFHTYAFANALVVVPEPSSGALFGLGLLALATRRRRSA